MSKRSSLVPTLELFNALKAKIAALELPNTFSAAEGYPKAFQSVIIYSLADLVAAMESVHVFDERVCLIVPGGDDHNATASGNVIEAQRITSIELVFSDQNYARENLALVGEANTSPGVLVLKEILITELSGENLGFNNIALVPAGGAPMAIRDKDTGDTRNPYSQTFSTYAGAMKIGIR